MNRPIWRAKAPTLVRSIRQLSAPRPGGRSYIARDPFSDDLYLHKANPPTVCTLFPAILI